MALMDAYGLSLVSVQVWGLLWGVLSAFVIVGGLVVARVGLGSNPLRTLLLANIYCGRSRALPDPSSIVLLAAGMAVFMLLMPFAEAAEQTILQKVVPLERQGRVFGFAQSVEQAASPLTAFLIGPIAQLMVIPFMTTAAGVDPSGGGSGPAPTAGSRWSSSSPASSGWWRRCSRCAAAPTDGCPGPSPSRASKGEELPGAVVVGHE